MAESLGSEDGPLAGSSLVVKNVGIPYTARNSLTPSTTISFSIRILLLEFISFSWVNIPQWAKAFSLSKLTITFSDTQTHSIGLLWTSNALDAKAATYTTHKTRKRPTYMSPAGFEPAIPASQVQQNHILLRADRLLELIYNRNVLILVCRRLIGLWK